MKPKISVVIPHLNQAEMLARCLESVCNQTMSRNDYEVIVVDNGSHQLPKDICDRYGAALLQEFAPGPGPARNKGIGESSADLLAFIDSDCQADTNWLASAYKAVIDPNVQIVGGDVRIAYVDPINLTALEAYESVFGYRQKLYIERMGFCATLNMAFKKSAFERIGPFAGIGVAEDIDWGHRASRFGFKIHYASNMKVFHPARKTMVDLKTKWNRHITHEYVSFRTSNARKFAWLAKGVIIGLSPFGDMITILNSDKISGYRSRAYALFMLVQIRLFRACKMIAMPFQSVVQEKPEWNASNLDQP